MDWENIVNISLSDANPDQSFIISLLLVQFSRRLFCVALILNDFFNLIRK